MKGDNKRRIEAENTLRDIAAREDAFVPEFECSLCGGTLTDMGEVLHEERCPIGMAKEYIESHNLPYTKEIAVDDT